jgi:hypothetical protein
VSIFFRSLPWGFSRSRCVRMGAVCPGSPSPDSNPGAPQSCPQPSTRTSPGLGKRFPQNPYRGARYALDSSMNESSMMEQSMNRMVPARAAASRPPDNQQEHTPVRPIFDLSQDVSLGVPVQPRQAFLEPTEPVEPERPSGRRRPRNAYMQPEAAGLSPITVIPPKAVPGHTRDHRSFAEIGIASDILPFAKRGIPQPAASFVQETRRMELPGMVG